MNDELTQAARALWQETQSKTNPEWPFYTRHRRRGMRVRCGNLAGRVTADHTAALMYLDHVALRLDILITPGERGYVRA